MSDPIEEEERSTAALGTHNNVNNTIDSSECMLTRSSYQGLIASVSKETELNFVSPKFPVLNNSSSESKKWEPTKKSSSLLVTNL